MGDVADVIERAWGLVTPLRRHDADYGTLGFKPFEPYFADDPACVIELHEAHFGREDTIV